MGIYETHILPKLTHWVCSHRDLSKQRGKVVPHAKGKVLEVGIGSGLNLPFYNPAAVERVWGVDPSMGLQKLAREKAVDLSFEVDFIGLSGEEIPLEKKSVDSVVVTYTLCSIPDVKKALKEMNRVLKPGGELIFCEHGKAPDDHVRKWQKRINPVWKRISGGCHLNRSITDLIEQGGFNIRHLESGYSSPLKIASYNYWGMAVHG